MLIETINNRSFKSNSIIKQLILLLHGLKSWACKTENIKEMAVRNKHVQLKIYPNTIHALHDDERLLFSKDVKEFLLKNIKKPKNAKKNSNHYNVSHRIRVSAAWE
jgi:hypothetical protein